MSIPVLLYNAGRHGGLLRIGARNIHRCRARRLLGSTLNEGSTLSSFKSLSVFMMALVVFVQQGW